MFCEYLFFHFNEERVSTHSMVDACIKVWITRESTPWTLLSRKKVIHNKIQTFDSSKQILKISHFFLHWEENEAM